MIKSQNQIIVEAIEKINSNAKVSVTDGNLDTLKWEDGTTPIPKADIEAKMVEVPTAEEEATAKENLKASAKAKLIAGQPLTEEEANTIVF